MSIFHILIAFLFGGFGVYHLVQGDYIAAIHFLLIALYFYVTLFEMSGRPFHRNIYLLMVILLTADGLINIAVLHGNIWSALFSFFFAFFSWQTYRKLSGK